MEYICIIDIDTKNHGWVLEGSILKNVSIIDRYKQIVGFIKSDIVIDEKKIYLDYDSFQLAFKPYITD